MDTKCCKTRGIWTWRKIHGDRKCHRGYRNSKMLVFKTSKNSGTAMDDVTLFLLTDASESDPIAILSKRALARSDSQRGHSISTTLGCIWAGLAGLLHLFLLLHTWVDRGRGGVGWWGGACWRWWEVVSNVHATLGIGLGGVGHVDVGWKLHRMCTLRWT